MVSLKCETWLCEFASLFCDIASSYFCAWSINLFQLLSFENGISGHQPKNLKAKQLTSMGNWVLVFSLKKKKKNESFISCLFFSKKENQENSSAILILNPGLSGSCYLHLFSAGILKFQNDLPKCKSFSSIVAVTYCPLSLLRPMFFNYGNFYIISLVWSPLF